MKIIYKVGENMEKTIRWRCYYNWVNLPDGIKEVSIEKMFRNNKYIVFRRCKNNGNGYKMLPW